MTFRPNRHAMVLEVIRLSSQISTMLELDAILDGPLKELLGYEAMICGVGFTIERPDQGHNGSYGHKFHALNFPLDYFYDLSSADGSIDSPLMQNWRRTLKPVYFENGRDDDDYSPEWVKTFNKYDLRNIIGHATLDRHSVVGNYFIYARLRDEVGPEQAELLELITPSLSLALTRAFETEECTEEFPGAVKALISNKQREILQWIYHGKTNWEISKIMEINEDTIKYHVDQAMNKLNVKTRAQAVGRALEIGAISVNKR